MLVCQAAAGIEPSAARQGLRGKLAAPTQHNGLLGKVAAVTALGNALGNYYGDQIKASQQADALAKAQLKAMTRLNQGNEGRGAPGMNGGTGLRPTPQGSQAFAKAVDERIANRVWEMQEADAYDRGDYVPGGGVVDDELPGMSAALPRSRVATLASGVGTTGSIKNSGLQCTPSNPYGVATPQTAEEAAALMAGMRAPTALERLAWTPDTQRSGQVATAWDGVSRNPYERTRANLEMALVAPQVGAIGATAAAYSPLGFAIGAGGDAAGQYYQNGEVRLGQSLFSGVTGAIALPLAGSLPAISS